MKTHFELNTLEFNTLEDTLFNEKKVELVIARLDKIHPIVSGNKLFKLHYFLTAAIESQHKTILTFGGAYSNHLVATAYACKKLGLKCIGIIRGEEVSPLSHSLQKCTEYGMQLQFIPLTLGTEHAIALQFLEQ